MLSVDDDPLHREILGCLPCGVPTEKRLPETHGGKVFSSERQQKGTLYQKSEESYRFGSDPDLFSLLRGKGAGIDTVSSTLKC